MIGPRKLILPESVCRLLRMTSTAIIEQKIQSLSPDLQEKVLHYINDILEEQKRSEVMAKFKSVSYGVLKELKKEYNSVDLQHQILS